MSNGESSMTKLETIRENPFIVSTIILAIIIVFLFVMSLIEQKNTLIAPQCNCEVDLCNVISGTPAWISNGRILDYGYKGNLSVDKLIENNLEFYYKEGCGYCSAQIQSFDKWEEYQNSGLTKKC